MAGNTDPIYSRLGNCASNYNSSTPSSSTMSQPITASNTNDYTGTNANNVLVFTADSVNGSFIQRLRFKAGGANTAGVVARVWINNGSANTTATNNSLYDEVSLPTTSSSTANSTPTIDLQMNFALPPGFRIYVGLAAAPTSAGWTVTPIAGNY